MDEEQLTFEDGIIFCKHLFQCAIHKTMKGVPEEWIIFFKTHSVLSDLGYTYTPEALEKVMFKLNLDDLYRKL